MSRAALLLAAAACADRPDPEPREPAPDPAPEVLPLGLAAAPQHLVVVSLDTTRRDHLGAFGDPRGPGATTPFLDARLAEGVVLADHRSCSNWTAPSMICAQTGRSPLDLGFWPGSGDPAVAGVPRSLPTIARRLGRAGFDTALVTGNRVFSSDLAADGFRIESLHDYADAATVTDAALEALGRMAPGPKYLHVHYMDPHRPYCPPADLRPDLSAIPEIGHDVCEDLEAALDELPTRDDAYREALLARVGATYDAELAAFDRELARLWSELARAGILDDALVLFHTDHGEQMLERGRIDHGFELHAEENRAAAAFWSPGIAPRRIEGPTLHQDLAATVFAVFGVPPEDPLEGVVLGEPPGDRLRRTFAWSAADHGPPQLGVVRGPLVLLGDWAGAGSFHDTAADPEERVDLRDAGGDALSGLRADWREFAEEVRDAWPHLGPPAAP